MQVSRFVQVLSEPEEVTMSNGRREAYHYLGDRHMLGVEARCVGLPWLRRFCPVVHQNLEHYRSGSCIL